MAATTLSEDKTTGDVSYEWTITQDDAAIAAVSVASGWHSFGPSAGATGTWTLKWQWSPDGTNFYDVADSSSTVGSDGIKNFRFSSGSVRPHLSGSSTPSLIAVFR